MDPFLPANIGAANPPPGVVHNFDHAQSRAIEGFIGMGVCIGITSVFVILRLYVKFAITHMWGWDDCKSLNMNIFLKTYANRCLPDGIREA